MLEIFEKWYRRYLFEEESVLLLVLIAVSVALLMTIGDILAPVLAAVVLAYLMQGVATMLQHRGLPEWLGVTVAYLLFMGAFFGFIFIILPLIWKQLVALAGEMPRMLEQGRQLASVLPERYPEIVSAKQLNQVIAAAQGKLGEFGQTLVTRSLATLTTVATAMVYLILIPILVFFFLKDRQAIIDWCTSFLPRQRPLLNRIWREMDIQVSNYARGKVLEILIVGATSFLSFVLLGLNYAALLGLLVGLSVIIPYLGAALVTLPVVLVAFFQWGFGSEFYTLFIVYLVIQALDGNLLVPMLFSEAVNLHPVAIILAVLFFGGIWGLWGVFFAIPLATLIMAIINAWPTRSDGQTVASQDTPHVTE